MKINYKIKLYFINFILLLLYLTIYEENKIYSQKKEAVKVSVFLPIYNKCPYLQRSIGSIQNQSLGNIEIIAVNDYSTDNTLISLKKMSKKDLRIKIVNNDRNHGLLYSRAMGILNSTGEYLMNLDPDDRLEGSDNLEVLYNTAKCNNSDIVRYLVKSIPFNKDQIKDSDFFNKYQFKIFDYLMTNKFVKKEIFLKVLNEFKKKIYYNKWNYHEDNIWSVLLHKTAKLKKNINKYVYIYKMNNQSLIINKYKNSIEFKNRVYLTQAYQDFNFKSSSVFMFNNMIYLCNYIKIKDIELKNRIIHIAMKILESFVNDSNLLKNINDNINKISNNKIIMFYKLEDHFFDLYLIYLTIFNYIKIKYNKIIISININNKDSFNNIHKYIFPNDILIGFNNFFFDCNKSEINKFFSKNKIILFSQFVDLNKLNKDVFQKYNSKFTAYAFNNNSYQILSQITKKENLYYAPNFITDLANSFNYNTSLKNNKVLIYFNETIKMDKKTIIKIVLKYYKNITIINSIYDFYNKTSIKNYRLILTNSPYLLKLSAINFISCILLKANSYEDNNYNLINKLNYIKYIYDLEQLEKTILQLTMNLINYNITIL
jgi:glycosyltransferase involved in cell wall biosynthesis